VAEYLEEPPAGLNKRNTQTDYPKKKKNSIIINNNLFFFFFLFGVLPCTGNNERNISAG
jgi:hypothetical protein